MTGAAEVEQGLLEGQTDVAHALDAGVELLQGADRPHGLAGAAGGPGQAGQAGAAADLLAQVEGPQLGEPADRAALEGRMIQGNEAALLEIYRASSDAQEKQAVLRQLTIIGGDAALEAIDAALQGKAP